MGTLAGHDHGRQQDAGRRGRLLLARGAALCESRLRGKTANPATAAKRGKGAMGDRGFASSEARVNRAGPSEARMGGRGNRGK